MVDASDAPAVTRDAFYGGRLVVTQPARGHRSGTEAVLLAAAAPRDFSGLAYDAGAGVGVAGLGLALRCPAAQIRLIENDSGLTRLAEENIVANALDHRVGVLADDLLKPAGARDKAQLVVTNPPFREVERVRASPNAARRAAHVLPEGVTLADWLGACLDLLASRGMLIVIHAAVAVPEILRALEQRAGDVKLLAIHSRAGAPAHRCLLRAVKGSAAPFAVAAPLVLHEEGGSFTAEAERLHRGEAVLQW